MANLSLVESIFFAALDKATPGEQTAYLNEACGNDDDLRRRVERLLKAHPKAGNFLESSAAGILGEGYEERGIATVDELPITERPGTVIGPYKLLEQIGEGGFGVVFMAEQQQPIRRRVAVKVLKPGMDTRRVIARFEAERQALALMDHPNIAKVHEADETAGGRPYFVMELVKGIPITDYCDQSQLTPRERLELFIPVCQAVQHAHQKGIIHRDIKPTNVLVTLHDGMPVPKIIDFGIAKALGQQLTDKTLFTNFAQMIGTPLYMSPEQAALSNVDVDTHSDVYSLGVLLYELLTGTTPFEKERLKNAGYDEMRRIICEEEPPKPSTRISTLGQAATTLSTQRKSHPKRLSQLIRRELDWIVMKCLEKDRNRRYETASALAADLYHYLHDEPVQACPPSTWYRFGKFARRNKARLGMAACVLIGLVAVGGSIGWIAGDRAARQAKAADDINQALQEAVELLQAGNWPEAKAPTQRAKGLLAGAGGDAALQQRLQQGEADLEMVEKLEFARLQQASVRDGHFDSQAGAPLYAAAFRDYNLPVMELEPGDAAERIRLSAIRDQLVAGLDGWARVRRACGLDDWQHLLAVAREADSNPWRDRLRQALLRGDGELLAELAGDKEVSALAPVSALLLADALEKVGKNLLAIEMLRKLQLRYPDDFWVNSELGYYYRNKVPAEWTESLRYCNAAVAIRPQSPGAWFNLGVALRALGKVAEAEAAYLEAVRLKPDYAAAHNSLGLTLKAQGRLDQALREFEEAIRCDTKYAHPHVNLGAYWCDVKRDYDRAIAEFNEAIRLKPDEPVAHFNLGIAFGKKGLLDKAIAEFRETIRLKQDYPSAHHQLGTALSSQRRLGEAVTALREAVRLQPEDANAHNDLGGALFDQGNCQEAEAAFREALRIKPNESLYHSSLGNALSGQTRFPEALAEYQEALRLQPKDANAHNQLAWFLATCPDPKFRDPSRALEEAKEAVTLAPSEGNYWNTMGVARYRAGEYQAALAALQKSMQLSTGGDSGDWFFLALAHWQSGRKEEARKWYDRAVEWMEKNKPQDQELRRFRAEAAELLGIKEKKDHHEDTKDTKNKP